MAMAMIPRMPAALSRAVSGSASTWALVSIERNDTESVRRRQKRQQREARLGSSLDADDRGEMNVSDLAGRRMTVDIEGDFVVFLIGAGFNSKLHLARSFLDLGGRRGMRHMLDYLVGRPEKGLLAYEMGIPTIVQYWRSFEHLEAFATNKDDPHLDVWRHYWRRVGRSGRTGIWHETYLVKAGQYECVYGNMPPHGLGKAGRLIAARESSGARARLKGLTV
jgi:hypothetical protein